MNQKIKNYIDSLRPINQMPGYGMIDLSKYIPTDDEVFINMLEYMSYWSSEWMFDYMTKNKFCELLEYLKFSSNLNLFNIIDVRQYKHIVVEKFGLKDNIIHRNVCSYNNRNMNDQEILSNPNCWYQELLRCCKTDPQGIKMLRELKLERILNDEFKLK